MANDLMYLTVHAAVAATIAGAVTSDPATALGIGILSHYAVDAIPHGDERVGEWTRQGNEVKRLMLVSGIDGLMLLVMVFAFWFGNGMAWIFVAAVVGGILPDVLWGLEKAAGRKLFGPVGVFHTNVHNFSGIRLPTWTGFLFQGIVAAVLWGVVL